MTEEELRPLAYRLWERAGCPDGRADEFWEQAWLQLGSGGSPTQGDRLNDSDEFADAPAVVPSERTSRQMPSQGAAPGERRRASADFIVHSSPRATDYSSSQTQSVSNRPVVTDSQVNARDGHLGAILNFLLHTKFPNRT
jgi:hypothetical protein